MKNISCKLNKFFLSSLCFTIIFFKSIVEVHAQDGSYSAAAQTILDTNSDVDLNFQSIIF